MEKAKLMNKPQICPSPGPSGALRWTISLHDSDKKEHKRADETK
jgi:hypothetical protein